MRENEVYQTFKRRAPSFDIDRIENAVMSGTFDTVVTHRTGMLWVELKVRSHVNVLDDFKSTQLVWAERKVRLGLGSKILCLSGHAPSQSLELWGLAAAIGDKDDRGGLRVFPISTHDFKGRAPGPSLDEVLLQVLKSSLLP